MLLQRTAQSEDVKDANNDDDDAADNMKNNTNNDSNKQKAERININTLSVSID